MMDVARHDVVRRIGKCIFLTTVAASLTVGVGMGGGVQAAGSQSAAAEHMGTAAGSARHWLKINRKSRHVVITVIAGWNGSNNGFNFDGYSSGKADFVVPLRWTVRFEFINHSTTPHSLALAKNHAATPKLARVGGKRVTISHAAQGIGKGKSATVTFVARTAGVYYLACDVPGHDALGMWDYFTISKHVNVPSVRVR